MCRTMRRSSILASALLAAALAEAAPAQGDPWLTKGHDARRTGQSGVSGPGSVDAARSWSTPLPGAYEINMGATVTADGVYFGSWGLQRTSPGRDHRFTDKYDGALYALHPLTGALAGGRPLALDPTPRCYEWPGRDKTPTDVLLCGVVNPWHASFYNGTVEGQPTVDPARGVMYVGRGDGKLYAVAGGRILWRYATFDPEKPGDPDGGGEVITSPLVGGDGTVWFGSWGEGPYETNAFYAVGPDGALRWRWPARTSLPHRFFASPALSPDGSTVYAAGWVDDGLRAPASLYAFHAAPGEMDDARRLAWSLELTHRGRPVWATTLAVGHDGTVYVGGLLSDRGNVPVLAAVEPPAAPGARPRLKWATPYVEMRDGAHLVLGIALRETAGRTVRIYAATASIGGPLGNGNPAGRLYAVDPATGRVLASYRPADDVRAATGGLNSPAIGADGVIYFGVRGRYRLGLDAARNGHVFAVRFDEGRNRFARVWSRELEGHVEWSHPAIGPDGALYIASSTGSGAGGGTFTRAHPPGTVPPGSTATFYGFRGP